MRVLVLGAAGMLGHKVTQKLRKRFDVWGTVRGDSATSLPFDLLDWRRIISNVNACSLETVSRAIRDAAPEVVINCIGIVRQSPAAQSPIDVLRTNSLFPHRLAALCGSSGARLIHISSDCVFSGSRGNYDENDTCDAADLYGRSKKFGELHEDGALTLRTSFVGRELCSTRGLVEWFLAQRSDSIPGWRRAIFSGVTTRVLAAIIEDVIARHRGLSGIYHVASSPISKYELLGFMRSAYETIPVIQPSDEITCDRSLNGERFRIATGFVAPPWRAMVEAMANDATPYAQWRGANAA